MNWLLVLVAATGVIAAPVLASVLAPGLVTQVAEQGFAVRHRHFVFDEQTTVEARGNNYLVFLEDGDLYELPLTTQIVLRGAVVPAPSDEDLRAAFTYALQKWKLPVLNYDVQRDDSAIVVQATLPAGVLANLSPKYQELVQKYEQPS